MVINIIIAVALFGISSLFVGVTEGFWLGLLYYGFAMVVIGITMIVSRPFREKFYRRYMNDPEGDKLLSEKQRNFFDQYYYPSRPILAGIAMIGLYCISHIQLIDAMVAWLKQPF